MVVLSLNSFQLTDRKWFSILDIPAHCCGFHFFCNWLVLVMVVWISFLCTQVRSLNSVSSSLIDSSIVQWQLREEVAKFTFLPGIWYCTLSLLSFNKMFTLSTKVSFFSFFREILYRVSEKYPFSVQELGHTTQAWALWLMNSKMYFWIVSIIVFWQCSLLAFL